ncbi:MAG: DUF411 domain-containing protein [Oleispira sp.]|nr:DUF411 domain-containing protein [Oleispira sp.]
MSFKLVLKVLVLSGFFSVLTACSKSDIDSQIGADEIGSSHQEAATLDVYKHPSCGCCGKWIDHLNESGLTTGIHNSKKLAEFKEEKGIAPKFRSCHTAVSKDGYVFEGHVPAKFIQQFLSEKPEGVIGLSVPSMPLGSPGMEVGNKFSPYQVLQLNVDGSSSIYASINNAQEQY